jgi:hypothetical protein
MKPAHGAMETRSTRALRLGVDANEMAGAIA